MNKELDKKIDLALSKKNVSINENGKKNYFVKNWAGCRNKCASSY